MIIPPIYFFIILSHSVVFPQKEYEKVVLEVKDISIFY